MNTPHTPGAGLRACLPCLMAFAGLLAIGAAEDEAATPRGSLTAGRDIVRAGTQAPLTWKVEVNDTIDDIVTVPPMGPIVPKRDLDMRVRVIGIKAATRSNNGHGNNLDHVDVSNPGQGSDAIDLSGSYDDEARGLWLELTWTSPTTSWTRSFSGDADALDPTELLEEITVKAGERLVFAARGFNSRWLPFYSTATQTTNIIALRNGDPLPPVKALQLGQIQGFLKPYLTADQHVRIGPCDLLYLVELNQTNPRKLHFDLQDLVCLVTFE